MGASEIERDVCMAKLFRSDGRQTLRIPVEFEFSSECVRIRKQGNRIVIEPESRPDLLGTLRSLSPLPPEDDFPAILMQHR